MGLGMRQYLFIYFKKLFVYLFQKRKGEKERRERKRQRGREGEIPRQVPSCQLRTDVELELTNCEIVTWAESKSWCLSN